MSKVEYQTMSYRTGVIGVIAIFAILSILAVYDYQISNEVEKTETEIFKEDMEGMLEKMQNKCNEFGSPGNFESDEMKSGWNDCMQEANEWLETNFP